VADGTTGKQLGAGQCFDGHDALRASQDPTLNLKTPTAIRLSLTGNVDAATNKLLESAVKMANVIDDGNGHPEGLFRNQQLEYRRAIGEKTILPSLLFRRRIASPSFVYGPGYPDCFFCSPPW
jgi:hypothetical protein